MCKSAYVGVYQLLNWKMHGETLKLETLWIILHENLVHVDLVIQN